jgi:ribonucleoside-triphosphate reductase
MTVSTSEPHRLTAIVRKRDGRTVPYDHQRLEKALAQAGAATAEFDDHIAVELAAVARHHLRDHEMAVEEIQDVVEGVLLSSPYRETAKAYILYRDQHARQRAMALAGRLEIMDSYLDQGAWQVRENANMAWSLQGLNHFVASEVTKTYWLRKIYPPAVRQAHEAGDLHIHDLGLLSVYCVGWDLADLLEQGFTGAAGKATSGPAKHFRAALGQIVNFFYTLQGEAAGAQAFASLDTYLAPFIRADELDEVEVEQALQEFVFNLNVPTRVGFQTPFTNITLDLEVPEAMRHEPVLLGGVRHSDLTYGQCQEEMDRFNRCFFKVLAAGDAQGRVFTFPTPTLNITDNFDFSHPRHQPLWEATAKYGIPYFANFVNSDLSPDDARWMCCRLRLDTRQLARRGGGLFGANPLTGSIGVVTINLPRLGRRAADEVEFMALLDHQLELARDSLEIKRKNLERLTDAHLYPYSSFYLRSIHERTGAWWSNHFSTIGLIGMHEAMRNLLGVGLDSSAGRSCGLRILAHMRRRLQEFQEETGYFYNLEATPAEGTGYRLARLDAERYPDMCFAHDGAADSQDRCRHGQHDALRPMYTNSSQLPVDWSDDFLAVLDHQDEFQCAYTGGTVVHVYQGEASIDPGAVAKFIETVCKNYRLPYTSLTPTFSVCAQNGYLPGEQPRCPHCDAITEVYSRVVGYLRPVAQWHDGKQEEFTRRATFEPHQVSRRVGHPASQGRTH